MGELKKEPETSTLPRVPPAQAESRRMLEDQHEGYTEIEGRLKKMIGHAAGVTNRKTLDCERPNRRERRLMGALRFGRAVAQERSRESYHTLVPSHKTCNFARHALVSAIETGLQSRWVVNTG